MNRRVFFLVATIALVLGCEEQAILHRAAPIVDLGYAKYQGSYNATSGVLHFLGIRYAAAPTGTLRWREPRTPEYTEEIQKAYAFGKVCHYAGFGTAPSTPFRAEKLVVRDGIAIGNLEPSEDCLFLNVWTPTNIYSNSPLPVIFWIHGGGYVLGDATEYHGTDLLDISKNGVVVLTIQYRVGVFGFLPGEGLKKGSALNAGLLDQQFALQWVQEHIHRFGGDRNRVTIWGESAGAGSVLQHVVANGGKTNPPLFHNAITSSTFLPSQYAYNDEISEAIYTATVNQAGCSEAPDTLACLRRVDASVLQSTNVKISSSGFYGTFVYVPVVDGTLIQQRPTEALKQRRVNGETFLALANSDEGSAFVDVVNYVKQLFPKFTDAQAKEVVVHYEDVGPQQSQPAMIVAEAIFVCPSYYLLNGFNQSGYKGEFAVPTVHHGQDVKYYWPSLDLIIFSPPVYTNAVFTKAFAQAFIDFAISDNPNIKVDPSSITPSWRSWGGETEMLLNRTEAGEPDIHAIQTSSTLLARCRFWEGVAAATAQ